MTKAEEIKNYMEKLGLTKEEAEQLWQDDHDDFETPEMKEMERKAKQIKRYEKSDTPRKKTVRKEKIDPIKREIISTLAKNVFRVVYSTEEKDYYPEDINILKPEKEITFTLAGDSYSISLIKHRPPK